MTIKKDNPPNSKVTSNNKLNLLVSNPINHPQNNNSLPLKRLSSLIRSRTSLRPNNYSRITMIKLETAASNKDNRIPRDSNPSPLLFHRPTRITGTNRIAM